MEYTILDIKEFSLLKAFSRLQNSTHQRFLYRRDTRLTGNPYVLKVTLQTTFTCFTKIYLKYLYPRVWNLSLIRQITLELSVWCLRGIWRNKLYSGSNSVLCPFTSYISRDLNNMRIILSLTMCLLSRNFMEISHEASAVKIMYG
jgi:hypothetical protein